MRGRCSPTAATPTVTTIVALHNFADAEVDAAPVLQGLAGAELTDVLDPRAKSGAVPEDGTTAVTLAALRLPVARADYPPKAPTEMQGSHFACVPRNERGFPCVRAGAAWRLG